MLFKEMVKMGESELEVLLHEEQRIEGQRQIDELDNGIIHIVLSPVLPFATLQ